MFLTIGCIAHTGRGAGARQGRGTLEAAWARLAGIKLYQGQLEPLVGGNQGAVGTI